MTEDEVLWKAFVNTLMNTRIIVRQGIYFFSVGFVNFLRGHTVTHPSTNHAQSCLTAVIRREPVYSTWYDRWHVIRDLIKCPMP